MIKVSVVVPIYNVSKYLKKCLHSLAEQKLKRCEFQVILIDDGSTDDSGKIADCFANMYSNFEVYHTPNQGVSLSRKLGVSKAKGEYIGFVDGDDYCDPDMYKILLRTAESNNLDIVACNNYCFTDKIIKESTTKSIYDNKVINGYKEIFNKIIKNTIINGNEPVVLWNKLYKNHLFFDYDVDFGNDILEDYLVNMQCLKNTKRYLKINKPLYYYRVSSHSLSRSFNKEIFNVLLEVQSKKEQLFKREFEKDESLVKNANIWFIKYIESIIKSLYLYCSGDLNKSEYLALVLSNPLVIKKSKELIKYGDSSIFPKMIVNKNYKLMIFFVNIYILLYRIYTKLKGKNI